MTIYHLFHRFYNSVLNIVHSNIIKDFIDLTGQFFSNKWESIDEVIWNTLPKLFVCVHLMADSDF